MSYQEGVMNITKLPTGIEIEIWMSTQELLRRYGIK